ncbi:hypothetical protein BDQ17DRAFT_1513316 [Cyathus striatus]|nr:hypothetical protein BDQ17DRAFT_1513316 [Cyathus striatus]
MDSDASFSFRFTNLTACTECRSVPTKVQRSQPVPCGAVRSYYVPNPSDRSIIEGIVSDSEVAIQTLETDLSNLQSQLSNTRRSHAFHRSLLSPIRKLPDDLLREIFSYVICGEVIDICAPRGHIWEPVQVCVRWRFSLVNSQKMKTKINHAYVPLRIKSCLEFSKAVPLSISLSDWYHPTLHRRVLEDIMNQADRVVSLQVFSKHTYGAMATFNQFSKLHSLNITGTSDIFYPEYTFQLFKNADHLEEVTLKDISILTGASEHIKWSKVKKLTLNNVNGSLVDFMDILRAVPLLEELEWINNCVDNMARAPEQMIVLPTLHTLYRNWFEHDLVYVTYLKPNQLDNSKS